MWSEGLMCILFPLAQLALVKMNQYSLLLLCGLNAIFKGAVGIRAAPVIQHSIQSMSPIKWTISLWITFLVQFPQSLYYHNLPLSILLFVYTMWNLILITTAIRKTMNTNKTMKDSRFAKWVKRFLLIVAPDAVASERENGRFWAVIVSMMYSTVILSLYFAVILDWMIWIKLSLFLCLLGTVWFAR